MLDDTSKLQTVSRGREVVVETSQQFALVYNKSRTGISGVLSNEAIVPHSASKVLLRGEDVEGLGILLSPSLQELQEVRTISLAAQLTGSS
eukprot:9486039-Pyramimonas_sp.AAC.1